jgi:signal transduction histidine kinase
VRTKSFQSVDLNQVAIDMVELYDAVAEQHSVSLQVTGHAAVFATGDHNLLASALASLIDNAIKYAGHGATVEVSALAEAEFVALTVRDNGPGIPSAELPKVTERFYRLDHSRNLPGNGLGLSIVSAIAALHSGTLFLENGAPGLIARMLLPAARADSSR